MKLLLVFAFAVLGMSVVVAEKAACPQICTMDYRPVCAIDVDGVERTFSNPCTLTAFNCAENRDFAVVRAGTCVNDEN